MKDIVYVAFWYFSASFVIVFIKKRKTPFEFSVSEATFNGFCGKHVSFVIFVLGNFRCFFFCDVTSRYFGLENKIVLVALWIADECLVKGGGGKRGGNYNYIVRHASTLTESYHQTP